MAPTGQFSSPSLGRLQDRLRAETNGLDTLVRPYAFGFTNTEVFETTTDTVFLDGRTNSVKSSTNVEFKRGQIAALRIYVAHPDGERDFLGTFPKDGY